MLDKPPLTNLQTRDVDSVLHPYTPLHTLREKGVLTDEFFLFLRRWLKAHIQGVDRQYGDPGLAQSA